MDDDEFLRRLQQRIEESAGVPVTLELDHAHPEAIDVSLSQSPPHIRIGADALTHPGLARMFLQYAILSLREGRKVGEGEFVRWLRRN